MVHFPPEHTTGVHELTINGEHIDSEVFSTEYRRLMQMQSDRPADLALSEEQIQEMARENVIVGTLLSQEARRRVPSLSESEVKHRLRQLQKQYGDSVPVDHLRPRVENELRIDHMYKAVFKNLPRVTIEQAKAEYEKDPSAYNEPAQVHCSHIVRHTFGGADPNVSLQQIMEAQDLLRRGMPFEEVSRRFSDQHGQAGDLGTFARGQMVDKFENVVFRMREGEISDVFQTEFGYHIALVHERYPERPRTFDEAKNDVVRALKERQQREAIDSLIEELRRDAAIEADSEGEE
jgi:parvulin-like peptidyl-prolyl isomerase